MSPGSPMVALSAQPVDVALLLAAVQRPDLGAVSVFIGQVRDHDPQADGPVVGLTYTAHPDAEQMLVRVISEVAPPDVVVAAVHRVGRLLVGEPALVVCVGSAHRQPGLQVCGQLVEQIKVRVPIWKQQHLADGGSTWPGLPVTTEVSD